MTRYNARTTNPSKFLEPKFNINPDDQNKLSKQNYQQIIEKRLSKQDYQN